MHKQPDLEESLYSSFHPHTFPLGQQKKPPAVRCQTLVKPPDVTLSTPSNQCTSFLKLSNQNKFFGKSQVAEKSAFRSGEYGAGRQLCSSDNLYCLCIIYTLWICDIWNMACLHDTQAIWWPSSTHAIVLLINTDLPLIDELMNHELLFGHVCSLSLPESSCSCSSNNKLHHWNKNLEKDEPSPNCLRITRLTNWYMASQNLQSEFVPSRRVNVMSSEFGSESDIITNCNK